MAWFNWIGNISAVELFLHKYFLSMCFGICFHFNMHHTSTRSSSSINSFSLITYGDANPSKTEGSINNKKVASNGVYCATGNTYTEKSKYWHNHQTKKCCKVESTIWYILCERMDNRINVKYYLCNQYTTIILADIEPLYTSVARIMFAYLKTMSFLTQDIKSSQH